MNRVRGRIGLRCSGGRAIPGQLALGLLLTFVLASGCTSPSGADPAIFVLNAEGEGNELSATVVGETAVIDVQSLTGIGSATVDLAAGAFPETMALRLNLKGLEQFRLTYDRTVISASVSSSDGGRVLQSMGSPGADEQPVASGSPFWMDIQIVADQGATHIPLDQGYFEITLPQDFIREGPRSFSFQWIDFYR